MVDEADERERMRDSAKPAQSPGPAGREDASAAPPLTTGHPGIQVLLTRLPLSLDAAFGAVRRTSCGGTALFVGTTRSPSSGRVIDGLEYEAYEDVARRLLHEVGATACAEHSLGAVYLAHRLGPVPAGEASVIVAAAAPHRADAFAGCRWLIEELKARVPIWKKEHWSGGGRWIGTEHLEDGPVAPEPANAPAPDA